MPITAFGTLVAYGMGSAVSWQYVAILGASLPVVLIPALSLIPDSPYWYLQNGDDKKALTVIKNVIFFASSFLIKGIFFIK